MFCTNVLYFYVHKDVCERRDSVLDFQEKEQLYTTFNFKSIKIITFIVLWQYGNFLFVKSVNLLNFVNQNIL